MKTYLFRKYVALSIIKRLNKTSPLVHFLEPVSQNPGIYMIGTETILGAFQGYHQEEEQQS